ncbi:MAG: InlB B-repeat-containing protein [Treponema sp.]|nr:InlB B-repeat-containing protein [Treponema sp.]
MKRSKYSIFSILLLSLTFIMASCDFNWFGDFSSDLDDKVFSTILFKSSNSVDDYRSFEKKYKNGITIYSNDLPDENYQGVINLKPGYTFVKWNSTDSSHVFFDEFNNISTIVTGPESSIIELYAEWEVSANTPYSVHYHFQDLTEDRTGVESTYTYDSSFDLILHGQTEDYTNVTQTIDVPGFECKTIEQKIIKGDGSTVVDVYLDRKQIEIFFDINGTINSTLNYFGTEITVPTYNLETGYEIGGWIDSSGNELFYLPYTPSSSETFTAKIIELRIGYKVRHYIQSLQDENDYTLLKEEEKTGLLGTQTSAEFDSPEGFEPKDSTITQITISVDEDQNIVEIYYNRKSYTVIIDMQPGVTGDLSDSQPSWTVKYGTKINEIDMPSMAPEGFALKGYSTSKSADDLISYPFEVKDNITLYAIWTKMNALSVSITNPVYESDIAANLINLSASKTGNTIKFTANENPSITKYIWYINGSPVAGNSSSSEYIIGNEIGTFEIVLIVIYNGESYAATINVTIEKGDL